MALCKLHIDQIMAFASFNLHYTSLKPSHTRKVPIVDIVAHLQTRHVYSSQFFPNLEFQLPLDVFLLTVTSQESKRASNETLNRLIDDYLLNRYTLFTETTPAVQQGPFLQALQTTTVSTGKCNRLDQRVVANLTFIILRIQNPQQVMLADDSSLGDLGGTKLDLKQLAELLAAYRLGNNFCLVCAHYVYFILLL